SISVSSSTTVIRAISTLSHVRDVTYDRRMWRLVMLAVTAASCGRLRFDPLGDAGVGDTAVADTAGDAAQVRPSCGGLPATCTSTPSGDCCAVTSVPGGTFYRGYDVAGDSMFPSMANPATVSAFHLDMFEVTVGRFRTFVAAGMGTQSTAPAAGSGAHSLITGSG